MTCEWCDKPGDICRIRRGRATYMCVDHMNEQMDTNVTKGDQWITVASL